MGILADDVFKYIVIEISIIRGPIRNRSVLFQLMVWYWKGSLFQKVLLTMSQYWSGYHYMGLMVQFTAADIHHLSYRLGGK